LFGSSSTSHDVVIAQKYSYFSPLLKHRKWSIVVLSFGQKYDRRFELLSYLAELK
jgi:hypothetical protein